MARYEITLTVEEASIKSVEAKLKKHFGEAAASSACKPRRWISESVWYNPLTWFLGHWEYKDAKTESERSTPPTGEESGEAKSEEGWDFGPVDSYGSG